MLVPSPKWLDTGDNAWQLAAATFVALQSIPGLTVLYGGVVKKKWAINSAFMSIYAFASVLVVWVLFDYNMAFGPQWFPFLGTPMPALSAAFSTRPGDHPRRRVGHAATRVPDGNAGLLPVRVRGDHRDHPRRLRARTHEFHGLGDLLPGVDDTVLYRGGVQPVGRRMARQHGGGRLLGRLRDPSCRRQPRASSPPPWSARACNRTASTSRRTACW